MYKGWKWYKIDKWTNVICYFIGAKPFKCPDISCARCFSRSDHLALHMKRHQWCKFSPKQNILVNSLFSSSSSDATWTSRHKIEELCPSYTYKRSNFFNSRHYPLGTITYHAAELSSGVCVAKYSQPWRTDEKFAKQVKTSSWIFHSRIESPCSSSSMYCIVRVGKGGGFRRKRWWVVLKKTILFCSSASSKSMEEAKKTTSITILLAFQYLHQ